MPNFVYSSNTEDEDASSFSHQNLNATNENLYNSFPFTNYSSMFSNNFSASITKPDCPSTKRNDASSIFKPHARYASSDWKDPHARKNQLDWGIKMKVEDWVREWDVGKREEKLGQLMNYLMGVYWSLGKGVGCSLNSCNCGSFGLEKRSGCGVDCSCGHCVNTERRNEENIWKNVENNESNINSYIKMANDINNRNMNTIKSRKNNDIGIINNRNLDNDNKYKSKNGHNHSGLPLNLSLKRSTNQFDHYQRQRADSTSKHSHPLATYNELSANCYPSDLITNGAVTMTTEEVANIDNSTTLHVKRPLNAFMVWSKDERKHILNIHPTKHNSDISKMLGFKWHRMSVQEKQPYFRKQLELKRVHMEKYPEYRYRPKQKLVYGLDGKRLKLSEHKRFLKRGTTNS